MQLITVVVYFVLFVLSVAAVKTVIPRAEASKPCLLGYKASCSFTPISTIILASAAISVFLLTRGIIA